MIEDEAAGLREAVIAVLGESRPHGLAPRAVAARLRQRLAPRGWTVRQVFEGLAPGRRPALDPGASVAAEQRALDELRGVLDELVQGGQVLRQPAQVHYTLNTKGSRLFEVDLYRLP